jgi:capsular exopolysaccharide synthesis family protein
MILGIGGAFVVLSHLTPIYFATSVILIDPRVVQTVSSEIGSQRVPPDLAYVQSQVSAIRSPILGQRVIRKLSLSDDPEFNPALRPREEQPFFEWVTEWLFSLVTRTGPPPKPDAELRSSVLQALFKRVTVWNEDDSYTLFIQAASPSAEKAAVIANAFAEEYIGQQFEEMQSGKNRAATWLKSRIDAMRESVQKTEQAVQTFRSASNLTQTRGETLSAQQLAELNAQLIMAKSDRSQAEARLSQIRGLQDEGKVETAAEVLSAPLIQRLREEEAGLLQRIAELTTKYGERHPERINLGNQIADLRAKIETETNRIIQSIQNEVFVARSREQALAASLEQTKAVISQGSEAEVKLAELERQATVERSLYETMLMRYKEMVEWERMAGVDARLISPAEAPPSPSFPNFTLGLMAATMLSGSLGVILALLIEALDRSFRSPRDVERFTSLPVICVVPEIRQANAFGGVARYIMQKPKSELGEALNAAAVFLHFLRREHPIRSLAVSSALPEEGKTSFASALSVVMSKTGLSVVLVDADLRRGQVARTLALNASKGLREYLLGAATLEETIYRHPDSGLAVVPTGDLTQDTPLIQGQVFRRFKDLLNLLSARFDLVIVDSAPVLAVAETALLAAEVDATIMIVRWGKSNQHTAEEAIKELRRGGANLVGLVMSRIDLFKHARYGFRDQASWYGQLKRYYQT